MGRFRLGLKPDGNEQEQAKVLSRLRKVGGLTSILAPEGAPTPPWHQSSGIEYAWYTTEPIPIPRVRASAAGSPHGVSYIPLHVAGPTQRRRNLDAIIAATEMGAAMVNRRLDLFEKEVKMRKLKARKLKVIAGDGPTLRELFDLARRLVQGRGPGKQYLNEAESANYEKPVYGVAGFNTSVDLERGHEPLEAMVMAGFILFGPTWVASFKAMEVPTDLHRAYFDLEHHFAPKAPPVQIPEPVKKVGITAVHISLPEPPKPARTKKKTTAVTDQPKHARIEGGPERIALPGQ